MNNIVCLLQLSLNKYEELFNNDQVEFVNIGTFTECPVMDT